MEEPEKYRNLRVRMGGMVRLFCPAQQGASGNPSEKSGARHLMILTVVHQWLSLELIGRPMTQTCPILLWVAHELWKAS